MQARDLVDVAIDEDPRAPCLWVPSELWPEFCAAIAQQPSGPLSDITTRRP